jgi:hypothetical protein
MIEYVKKRAVEVLKVEHAYRLGIEKKINKELMENNKYLSRRVAELESDIEQSGGSL